MADVFIGFLIQVVGLGIAPGLRRGVGLVLFSGIGHLSIGVEIISWKCVCRWMTLLPAGLNNWKPCITTCGLACILYRKYQSKPPKLFALLPF